MISRRFARRIAVVCKARDLTREVERAVRELEKPTMPLAWLASSIASELRDLDRHIMHIDAKANVRRLQKLSDELQKHAQSATTTMEVKNA
jgi:hypothetical protein